MGKKYKDGTLGKLMENAGAITKEMENVDYHLDLLNKNSKFILSKFPNLKNMNNLQIIEYFKKIFDLCDQNSKNYNPQIDADMTRIGNYADKFFSNSLANDYYRSGKILDICYENNDPDHYYYVAPSSKGSCSDHGYNEHVINAEINFGKSRKRKKDNNEE